MENETQTHWSAREKKMEEQKKIWETEPDDETGLRENKTKPKKNKQKNSVKT